MKKSTKKLLIFISIVVILFLLEHHYGFFKDSSFDDVFAQIEVMVDTNFAKAVIIYMVVTIIGCSILAVPGFTFALVAGATFGPIWGTLLCSFACTIGAIIAFIIGRFFLKDSLKEKIAKNKYIDRLLFNEDTKDEMLVLMITRLVPVFPFNLQNLAYGITDISLWKYSIGTFIFIIPGTAMYTIGTYALTSSTNRLLYICITVVLVCAVVFVSKLLKKKYVSSDEIKEDDDEQI